LKNNPIYTIQNFNAPIRKNDLYVNTFKDHLKDHSFIEKPHRHNFYLLVLFTKGSGIHEIDFDRYEIRPGSLFVLQPGQIHNWQLSADSDGYIVFYSQQIYNLHFGNRKIEDYPFYRSVRNNPEIVFENHELDSILPFFELMTSSNQHEASIMLNLLDCIHIKISKKYTAENRHSTHSYNHKIQQFELILEQFYKTEKSPSFYASKMNMTLKHLNRICKNILDKTVTELITNRVILESKRLLINPKKSINQVADDLGFKNYSYFTKLFKKNADMTPSEFRTSLK
jgi:AraC family transcriptional activator of pobA